MSGKVDRVKPGSSYPRSIPNTYTWCMALTWRNLILLVTASLLAACSSPAVTPSPASELTPAAATPTPTTIPENECSGLDRESKIVKLALPEFANPLNIGRFLCINNTVSGSMSPAAGHSRSVEITRYETDQQAQTALGPVNASFQGFPAVHETRTGYPGPESLQETLAWQMSMWLFRVASFDDTAYRIGPSVSSLAERLHEAASQLGIGASPTQPPRPVPEAALGNIFVLGDTVVVTVAILGPVAAEPSATLDGRSSDEVKRNTRTLLFTHIFRNVKKGEHQVHVSGGGVSRTERVVVGQTETAIAGLRSCQVLPLPPPTPVPPGVPTPTPSPVLEIRVRSVEAFDGHIKTVFWFGPGGYGSVTLDGNPPDVVMREASGPPTQFIFLAVGGGDHVLLAQGYPHRLEVKVGCP